MLEKIYAKKGILQKEQVSHVVWPVSVQSLPHLLLFLGKGGAFVQISAQIN